MLDHIKGSPHFNSTLWCIYSMYGSTQLINLSPLYGYIVNEETSAIMECLWEDSVTKHMPKSEDEFKRYGGGVAVPLLLVSRRWVSYTN